MHELHFMAWVALTVAVAVVAFLYSSVGHGGATGYLAVLALAGVTPDSARAAALLMNCLVAGLAWWSFSRAGHFNFRVLLPLMAASVPCAWLASRIKLPPTTYGILLGGVLIAAGLCLSLRRSLPQDASLRPPSTPIALGAGGGLGLLAGLTGIGGGVFLSPLLIFMRWTTVRTTGGIAAAFIVMNSLAGLAGLSSRLTRVELPLLALALPVGAAAMLGTHYGVRRWSDATFGRVLAGILVLAGGKMLFTALI